MPEPQRPHRLHAIVYTIGEEIAERYRMHKTDSRDPDPEMGRGIAEFHRKLRESKARTDAERVRRDERRQDDAGGVHQDSNPDERED